MSRQIKFKFFDKSKNCFVPADQGYTFLVVDCEGDVFEVENDSAESPSHYREEVVPLLFTGLKDKNGKEIYEGDIVRTIGYSVRMEPSGPYEVQYNESSTSFVMAKPSVMLPLASPLFKEIEVIGNIYEHRHLLTHETPIAP